MTKQLHLIYLPGLGDIDSKFGFKYQRWAVNKWRLWGVQGELLHMRWATNEDFDLKLSRVLHKIDELKSDNKAIALVGASAGASMAINAYAARKDDLVGVICLAGKVNRPENIGKRYQSENPALKSSVIGSSKALSELDDNYRQRIMSRYALADETVSKADSIITGAVNRRVIMAGHVFTIATQILYGVPGFCRFLKRLAKQQI